MPAARGLWLRRIGLALVVLVPVGVLVSGAARGLDLERVIAARGWLLGLVEADRPRALALAALGYVGAGLVSLPATLVLTALCGFLFGTVTGALLAVCSATTAAVIVFEIGRAGAGDLAGDLLRRRAGPRLAGLAEGFRRDAFGYVVLMRVLPVVPFWLTNLGPAVLGVRVRTFALATFLGLLPGAFVYAATGAGIDAVVARHEAARAACRAQGGPDCEAPLTLTAFVTPPILAALAALAGLAVLAILLRHRLSRSAASPPPTK